MRLFLRIFFSLFVCIYAGTLNAQVITKEKINKWYDSASDIRSGQPDLALQLSDSIAKWADAIGWNTGKGEAIALRAYVHSTRDDISHAIGEMLEALKLYESDK